MSNSIKRVGDRQKTMIEEIEFRIKYAAPKIMARKAAELNVSKQRIVQDTGISPTTVRKLMNGGIGGVTASVLFTMCHYLEISPTQIIMEDISDYNTDAYIRRGTYVVGRNGEQTHGVYKGDLQKNREQTLTKDRTDKIKSEKEQSEESGADVESQLLKDVEGMFDEEVTEPAPSSLSEIRKKLEGLA